MKRKIFSVIREVKINTAMYLLYFLPIVIGKLLLRESGSGDMDYLPTLLTAVKLVQPF